MTDHPSQLTDRPVRRLTGRPIRAAFSGLIGTTVVIAALAWSQAGASQAASTEPRPPTSAQSVRLASVQAASPWRSHRSFGVTRAAQRAHLAFTLGGRLTERPVALGDRIEAGHLLARLDRKPLRNGVAAARAQLAQVDAQLAQARRDAARVRTLHQRDAATAEAVERTQSGVQQLEATRSAARNGLREARRVLAEGGLTAPFAGMVTAVHFQVGEFVPPGRPVISLAGDAGIEVRLEVPESVVAQLHLEDAVSVRLPLLQGRTIEGYIERVGGEVVGPAGLFPVVVHLPTTGDARAITSALTAEVTLRVRAPDALAVPVAAVVDPAGGHPRVFRVIDGLAQQVPITVGALLGEGQVVVSRSGDDAIAPLSAGEVVVTGGHYALLNGDPVRPAEPTR
jgi:RND family efflux transporter MFP subunit